MKKKRLIFQAYAAIVCLALCSDVHASTCNDLYELSFVQQIDSVARILERISNNYSALALKDGKVIARPQLSKFHKEKLAYFINKKLPIKFVLPAFPAKSPNRDKTISEHIDMAEVQALFELDKMCEEIKGIYSPGAHVVIASDGRVFSDIVNVPDEWVTLYGKEVSELIHKYALKNLSIFNLEDSDISNKHFDSLRKNLELQYASPLEELKQRVQMDRISNNQFNGIHLFIKEDMLGMKRNGHPNFVELSKNKIEKLSKSVAYEVIRRSEAWGKLVGERFPTAIRLSIHPQPETSEKIGISFIKTSTGTIEWATPWHRSVIFENGRYRMIRSKDAIEKGATIKYFDQRYPYFEIPPK